MAEKYCPICGNTGIKLDGTPCECKMSREVFTSDIVMLDVPEQYQGIRFNKYIVDPKMGSFYYDYLYKEFPMDLSDFSIIVDCANGSTSEIAPIVFKHFNSKLTVIDNQPDGLNINKDLSLIHI